MLPDENTLQDFHTDLSVGNILRRARLKKNLSIEDLEQAIKVSAPHILAIEEGRFEVLPARVYVLGFIRTYAEYVDLDSTKILGLLKRQEGEKIIPKENFAMESNVMEDHSLPNFRIFALILVVFFTVIGLKSLFKNEYFLPENTIPDVPHDLKSQTTLLNKPENKTPEISNENNKVKDNQEISFVASNQIVLKAIENVWIDIRDSSGKTIFSRVLNAGEEYWVSIDQTDLKMTLGNAGGLQIMVGDKTLPSLGKSGQVIRKLSLNPDFLKEMLKNTPKKTM